MSGDPATAKRKRSATENTLSATKRMRSSFAETLKVIAGQDESAQTFFVHKDLIVNHSKFFKAATSTQTYIEAVEKTVRLPEHEGSTFHIYLECLYNPLADLEALAFDAVAPYEGPDMEADPLACFMTKLAKCWVLGDYIGDSEFKKKAIKIFLNSDEPFTGVSVQYITSNTVCSSGLHRLLVERIIRGLKYHGYSDERHGSGLGEFSESLTRELLRRMLQEEHGSDFYQWIPSDSEDFFDEET